jgi:RNA polymerase sigma-70 factor (ECF subfamily)
MRRHSSRIYRAACAIVRDAGEAEDVVQEACARAYEHLGEFEGRARFSTWLTRIAVHEALARVRGGKRAVLSETHAEEPSLSAGSGSSPEQKTSDLEMRPLLETAVAKLPDGLRAVFVLRAVEEMSGAEVAECLGISEDAVKTRLHRARSRLREMLIESIEPSLPFASEDPRASTTRQRVRFDNGPLPMWIYDTETLAFLAVNDAAVRHYGYRREEFAALTLEGIRPQEDVAALRDDVARHTDAGRVWRHRKKDGSVIAVEVRAHDFAFKRRRSRLVLATERLRPTFARA